MRFETIITKKMLVKIFRKRYISSNWIKLWNSVYEKNRNMAIHEQDTISHIKSMLNFYTLWKHQIFPSFLIFSGGIGIVKKDLKIAQPKYIFNINDFGIKITGISSKLTELKILFYTHFSQQKSSYTKDQSIEH